VLSRSLQTSPDKPTLNYADVLGGGQASLKRSTRYLVFSGVGPNMKIEITVVRDRLGR
jgi:hypothetical protein